MTRKDSDSITLELPDFASALNAKALLAIALVGLMALNQFLIFSVNDSLGGVVSGKPATSLFSFLGVGGSPSSGSRVDLAGIDVAEFKSTAQTLVGVFPELKDADDQDAVLSLLLPAGTPDYSEALGGITYDDPVTSLKFLAGTYKSWEADVKQNDPDTYARFLNLASKPVGISCEMCCGVGAAGLRADGRTTCGCSHHPGLLALAVGLMDKTEYNDAEVMREVMKWKTLWFPQKMVKLALESAGKDASDIPVLQSQVGGC